MHMCALIFCFRLIAMPYYMTATWKLAPQSQLSLCRPEPDASTTDEEFQVSGTENVATESAAHTSTVINQ